MKIFKHRKENGIALFRSKKSIPFVHIQFPGDDMVYLAMIDTGCEVTILDSSMLKKIKNINTCSVENVSLNGFCGSTSYENCIKFDTDVMMCDCMLNDVNVNINGIVSSFKSLGVDKTLEKFDAGYPIVMIIGGNTLNQINGSVDYMDKVLYIREPDNS